MVADNLTSHVYMCVFADVQIQVESSNETDGSESCVYMYIDVSLCY